MRARPRHFLFLYVAYWPVLARHLLFLYVAYWPVLARHLLFLYVAYWPVLARHLLFLYVAYWPVLARHLPRRYFSRIHRVSLGIACDFAMTLAPFLRIINLRDGTSLWIEITHRGSARVPSKTVLKPPQSGGLEDGTWVSCYRDFLPHVARLGFLSKIGQHRLQSNVVPSVANALKLGSLSDRGST
jgi:hypothetical protein